MPAFLKVGDIKGSSTDTGHVDWIRADSVSAPVFRTVHSGAKDQQRTRGETTLGDVSVVKQVDDATAGLMTACVTGKFIAKAQVDVCTTINGVQTPYLTYKLQNVIVTSYSINASGEGQPTENITLSYTDVDWDYSILNPKTGAVVSHVPDTFSLGKTELS